MSEIKTKSASTATNSDVSGVDSTRLPQGSHEEVPIARLETADVVFPALPGRQDVTECTCARAL